MNNIKEKVRKRKRRHLRVRRKVIGSNEAEVECFSQYEAYLLSDY